MFAAMIALILQGDKTYKAKIEEKLIQVVQSVTALIVWGTGMPVLFLFLPGTSFDFGQDI